MQKYLHLLQIVETEKTVAKQLRQQIEDGEIEIERLKSEVILAEALALMGFDRFEGKDLTKGIKTVYVEVGGLTIRLPK